MPTKTTIEWTDYSSGLIAAYNIETEKRGWFCVHKSEGCRHCYAETLNLRWGNGLAYKAPNLSRIRFEFVEKEAIALIKLSQRLGKKGQTAKVFPCDMTDIFLPEIGDEIRDKVFATFALCPNLIFQVLTKRPDVMREYLNPNSRFNLNCIGYMMQDLGYHGWAMPHLPLPNVWLGGSVENQTTAASRIPHLLATPAAVRWLSCEPLLGPVDLRQIQTDLVEIDSLTGAHGVIRPLAGRSEKRIHWIVAGGESGPQARPCHPDWARSLRDQCQAASVPFFFKQWGQYAPEPATPLRSGQEWPATTQVVHLDGRQRSFTGWTFGDTPMFQVGKKKAGRLLDGQEWNEMPETIGELEEALSQMAE